MRVIKPVAVNATTFISSTVAEPDVARGEVEYSPTLSVNEFKSTIPSASTPSAIATGKDGNLYYVGALGSVGKLDVKTGVSSSFGVVAGEYLAASLAPNGFIYCVGDTGVVLKINTENSTVSTFGTYSVTMRTCAADDRSNIYCAGFAGDVIKINTETDSVSIIGTHSASSLSTSVYSPAFGIITMASAAVAQPIFNIDVFEDTVTNTGVSMPTARSAWASFIGYGGLVYFTGGNLSLFSFDLKTNTLTEKYYSPSGAQILCASVAGDGFAYGGLSGGSFVKIDTENSTVTRFGSSVSSPRPSIELDGSVYFGTRSDGNVSLTRLSVGYPAEYLVVDSAQHSKYKSAVFNSDTPAEGITKTPPTWVYVSPTNKYAMLDDFSTTGGPPCYDFSFL